MKFSKFREFRPGNEVSKYLGVDLVFTLRELFTGLSRLNFNNNFQSFETEVTVPAGSELAIRNELGEVPSGKIILRDGGSNQVVDGDTAWDDNFVYLKNLDGSNDVTVKVVFLR